MVVSGGTNPMPRLTSLILECIRLDHVDLNMVNSGFPSLQDVHLIGVGQCLMLQHP